jgi:hypothetical protein
MRYYSVLSPLGYCVRRPQLLLLALSALLQTGDGGAAETGPVAAAVEEEEGDDDGNDDRWTVICSCSWGQPAESGMGVEAAWLIVAEARLRSEVLNEARGDTVT